MKCGRVALRLELRLRILGALSLSNSLTPTPTSTTHCRSYACGKHASQNLISRCPLQPLLFHTGGMYGSDSPLLCWIRCPQEDRCRLYDYSPREKRVAQGDSNFYYHDWRVAEAVRLVNKQGVYACSNGKYGRILEADFQYSRIQL